MKRSIVASTVCAFVCTAAQAAPPRLPPQLQAQAEELLKDCAEPGGKNPGTLGDYYATVADFNGDGVDDYVIDDGALSCGENGGFLFSGSAGSPVAVWLSQPDGSWKQAGDIGGYMQGWEIKERNGRKGIEYEVHGAMCGKGRAGSDGCTKFWTAPQAKANAARDAHAPARTPASAAAAPAARKETGGYYDRSAAPDDGASTPAVAPCVPPKPPKRHGGVHGLLDRMRGKTNSAPPRAGDCVTASAPQSAPAPQAQATPVAQPSAPPAPSKNAAAIDRAVKAYIAGLNKRLADNQETAEATQIEMADLDGDGKDEAVLLYTTYGPTFWDAGLTVLADCGKGYVVVAESNDALGNVVEKIEAGDGLIRVHALWQGPDDANCCPTVKRTTAYRLRGNALVKAAPAGGR